MTSSSTAVIASSVDSGIALVAEDACGETHERIAIDRPGLFVGEGDTHRRTSVLRGSSISGAGKVRVLDTSMVMARERLDESLA
jgi:hypothetical protein